MIQLQLPFHGLESTIVKFFHYRFGYWNYTEHWFEQGMGWAKPFVKGLGRSGGFQGFSHLILSPDLDDFDFDKNMEEFKIIVKPLNGRNTWRRAQIIQPNVNFNLKDILYYAEIE